MSPKKTCRGRLSRVGGEGGPRAAATETQKNGENWENQGETEKNGGTEEKKKRKKRNLREKRKNARGPPN